MDVDSGNNGEFGQWNKSSEDVLKHKYPLHRASRDGDMETLSLLVVSGQQNPLLEDEFYGWTPAHWAAYFGKLACLRRLMQVLSVEPMTSRYQQTPAHLAAYSGHPHCLSWLLNTGSDIQQQDYLGETPAHKAARTGSMECISLLAAEQADLNIKSNVGLSPAELAARCGYVDCALYLQRAAEQQALKRSGIIDDVMLPVVQTQAVLPGQKPDRCIITQGINGGRLPNSIDSEHIPRSNGMCMDMDMEMHDTPNGNTNGHFMDGNMNGHAAHGELTGLNTHHYNGFGNNNSHVQNGNFPSQPKMNGFSQLGVNGGQKDVLLSQDVLLNLVPIAGRKRGREEIDDGAQEEWKRVRRLETGGGDFGCQERLVRHAGGFLLRQQSTSVEEYRSCMLAEQGYDSLMFDSMLAEYHGT